MSNLDPYLSPEGRCDLERTLDEILDGEHRSATRIDTAEDLFGRWAGEGDPTAVAFVRSCLRHGYGSALTAREKANRRQNALLGGQVRSKPAVGGRLRTRSDGASEWVQDSFWDMGWADLQTSALHDVRTSRTYSDSAAMKFRMLDLRDLAPTATNPGQAADAAGVDREAWLLTEEAS